MYFDRSTSTLLIRPHYLNSSTSATFLQFDIFKEFDVVGREGFLRKGRRTAWVEVKFESKYSKHFIIQFSIKLSATRSW